MEVMDEKMLNIPPIPPLVTDLPLTNTESIPVPLPQPSQGGQERWESQEVEAAKFLAALQGTGQTGEGAVEDALLKLKRPREGEIAEEEGAPKLENVEDEEAKNEAKRLKAQGIDPSQNIQNFQTPAARPPLFQEPLPQQVPPATLPQQPQAAPPEYGGFGGPVFAFPLTANAALPELLDAQTKALDFLQHLARFSNEIEAAGFQLPPTGAAPVLDPSSKPKQWSSPGQVISATALNTLTSKLTAACNQAAKHGLPASITTASEILKTLQKQCVNEEVLRLTDALKKVNKLTQHQCPEIADGARQVIELWVQCYAPNPNAGLNPDGTPAQFGTPGFGAGASGFGMGPGGSLMMPPGMELSVVMPASITKRTVKRQPRHLDASLITDGNPEAWKQGLKTYCQHAGCTKRAQKSEEGTTVFCIAHMREHGLRPEKPLCQHPGCSKRAETSTDGQVMFCLPHMRQHNLEPKQLLCAVEECQKLACSSMEGVRLYCIAHMRQRSLTPKKPMCQHPECTKRAIYSTDGMCKFCMPHMRERGLLPKKPHAQTQPAPLEG